MEYGFVILKEGVEVEAISVEDMRAYEINAVGRGIPLLLLMENAGRSVADYIEYKLGDVKGKRIAIIAGKGGNAGDGFVAARHLAGRGARVEVHLAFSPLEVSHSDARVNLDVIMKMESIKIHKPFSRNWLEVSDSDVVVDALLGTGVRGSLRSPIREAIKEFNNAPGFKVSIDVPSGVDPDTGRAADGSARAEATVTMHKLKRGLLKAREYTGEIAIASIGLTSDVEFYAGPGDVAARVPHRPKDAHKGVGGRVLVVAGSKYYVGAALLTATAAARTGVDLVYLASTRSIAEAGAERSSTIIPTPYEGDILTKKDVERLEKVVERVHSIAIGPGLGRESETIEAFCHLINKALQANKPVVVDADGLYAIQECTVKLRENVVLTPHRGEASRLLGGRQDEPTIMAREIASKLGSTTLVKGPLDVACSPSGRCRMNRTGVPAMSVGGTGDVLTGVIAGILAKRNSILGNPDPLNSAITGAYIVGKAGELAYQKQGESLTAFDLLDILPSILRDPLNPA
ncbi:MAG: NAD(P)H-hydrate dehydratase [Crenarchaeota archaeon]|nr:NAD(P)H-hydrate dehydratase [Thermoproteota archaeon]